VALFAESLKSEASSLLECLRGRRLRLVTAESCTGGMIAGLLTEIPGSSDVFERGFVTYSNEAKAELLGVPADLIAKHGAVSEAVARAMAEGALARSHADIAVSVTGVAGPGGGTEAKPVGLVHFGASMRGGGTLHVEKRFGDPGRSAIRLASVAEALAMVREPVAAKPS
jgi:nicotinamide-nucleotide amidase